MQEENPLEKLLDQLGDMLKFIKDNENTPASSPLPEDVEQKLAALESNIALFSEVQKKLMTQAGVNEEALWKAIRRDEEAKFADLCFFEHAKELENNARQLNLQLTIAMSQGAKPSQTQPKPNDETKNIQKNDKKKAERSRKQKFRKIGGDKGWIPL